MQHKQLNFLTLLSTCVPEANQPVSSQSCSISLTTTAWSNCVNGIQMRQLQCQDDLGVILNLSNCPNNSTLSLSHNCFSSSTSNETRTGLFVFSF